MSEIIEHFGRTLPTVKASEIISYLHGKKGLILTNKNIFRRWRDVNAGHDRTKVP